MKRRGFIARVAALVAAPFVAKKAAEEHVFFCALKEVYPPGCFEALVEKESPFLRRLKGGS